MGVDRRPRVAAQGGDELLRAFQAGLLVVRATHAGGLWGIKPTHRTVEWTASVFNRIADGKVVEQWATEDWIAILTQLGHTVPPWVENSYHD